MIARDPIFLEMIKKLKVEKPQNYRYREIDLYNDGKDAIQQETMIIGNVLQVLSLPTEVDVYIQFNETENPTFKLEEGIILFTFYRFFLTFKHTERETFYHKQFLLKYIVGKDFILASYPASVEKVSKILIDNESFSIPSGDPVVDWYLMCKNSAPDYSLRIGNFNQLRGIVKSTSIREKIFTVAQYTNFSKIESEVTLPKCQGESYGTQEFFIDLVGEIIAFYVERDLYKDYELFLSAKLWNI